MCLVLLLNSVKKLGKHACGTGKGNMHAKSTIECVFSKTNFKNN